MAHSVSETTDVPLPTVADLPLAQAVAMVQAGADAVDPEVLKRIAPADGSRVLLVAASFNSAI